MVFHGTPWYTMVTPHSQLLPVMLTEAKTSRPRLRPKLRGRGQSFKAKAEAEARTMKSRPRPKIIMKQYQTMINNICFKIIAGKSY